MDREEFRGVIDSFELLEAIEQELVRLDSTNLESKLPRNKQEIVNIKIEGAKRALMDRAYRIRKQLQPIVDLRT